MKDREGVVDRRRLSVEVIEQMIENGKREAQAGHDRLRKDIDELNEEIKREVGARQAAEKRIQTLEQAPTSVEKMTFTWKVVVAIVGGAIAISGTGLRMSASMSDLKTTFETTTSAMKAQGEADKELQKERDAHLSEAISTIDKQQKLEAIDIQNLKNQVTAAMLPARR